MIYGAPLEKLQNQHQKIELFWKGKTYRRFLFMENKELIFSIKGNPNDQGFFELRVTPTFNLKKMKISEETRDLGIQFYYPW